MRKISIKDKALYKVVKEKEDYYDEHYKPLHERSLEIAEEGEKLREAKKPHMKKIGKLAEKAIKLIKKHSPIEDEFEELGQVYVEDNKVVLEITNVIDDFKKEYLERKVQAKVAKKQ